MLSLAQHQTLTITRVGASMTSGAARKIVQSQCANIWIRQTNTRQVIYIGMLKYAGVQMQLRWLWVQRAHMRHARQLSKASY